MRSQLFCALLLVPAGCVGGPISQCHEQLTAAYGCCAFCQDDCEVSAEEIRQVCGDDDAELVELIEDLQEQSQPEDKAPAVDDED